MKPDYQSVLGDLERIKVEADIAIGAIRKLLGIANPIVVNGHRNSRQNSLPSRIVELFEQNPGSTFRAEEIADCLGAPVSHVPPALFRLLKIGRIVQKGRGLYGYKSKDDSRAEVS